MLVGMLLIANRWVGGYGDGRPHDQVCVCRVCMCISDLPVVTQYLPCSNPHPHTHIPTPTSPSPSPTQQATHALLWPFATDAVHCTNPPALLPAHLLLYSINEWLARTAIMVAPLKLPGGGAEEGPSRGGGTPSPTLATVDVPLPLDTASSSLSHVGGDTARGAEHGGRVAGVVSTTGDVVHVPLPPGCDGDAQHALGLDTAVGCVRMLQVQPGGGGMVVVVPPVHGDLGGDHETQR